MSHLLPFPIQNFDGYCQGLQRVGIDPGFVMYTNSHAGGHQPAARMLHAEHLPAAQAYINSPSDETFKPLVQMGVMLDTEWERQTARWEIISFEGWETLHEAFSRLHAKSAHTLQELTGISVEEFSETL